MRRHFAATESSRTAKAFILLATPSDEGILTFPVMSSSPSASLRFSSSGRVKNTLPSTLGGAPSLVTALLLGLILATASLILGAARLWTELPLLGAVAVLILIQGWRLTTKPVPFEIRQLDLIDLSVVLFVLYALARWLTSPAEYFSRIEAMDVVAYAGVFFTCRYGLKSRPLGLALLFLLVTLGVFETGFGYYLSNHSDWFPFGDTERLQIRYLPRWIGTYGCPNHYASVLVMAIGAALAMGSFSKLPWPVRIVLFYLAAAMLIGVMFSGSRGSWLSFVASILALNVFGLRNGAVRWWVPVTATVIVLAAAGTLFSLSRDVQSRVTEIEKIFESGSFDAYVRIQLAEDALHISHDYPLFGTGPGTFVFEDSRYQSKSYTTKAVLTHDDYLNCLADYGLVGFGIAMIFVTTITLKFFKPLSSDKRWQDRAVIAAAVAAWAALLAHSFVDFNLHIPANALWLFSLAGLGLGRLSQPEEKPHWSTVSLVPLGRWLGWAIILLCLPYGLEVGRMAVSDIIYEQAFAKDQEVPTNQSIDNAQEALSHDPGNVQALIFLGDVYRFQASRNKDLDDRVSEGQKALDIYQRALKANELDDSIQGRIGMTLDVMRKYDEAFPHYKAAVTEQPYNGQYWYWLGNHYWECGMLENAEQAYLRSMNSPHGGEASGEAEKQLRDLPEMIDVPLPPPDADPLVPASLPERVTIP
jgi:O-Antigen ligase